MNAFPFKVLFAALLATTTLACTPCEQGLQVISRQLMICMGKLTAHKRMLQGNVWSSFSNSGTCEVQLLEMNSVLAACWSSMCDASVSKDPTILTRESSKEVETQPSAYQTALQEIHRKLISQLAKKDNTENGMSNPSVPANNDLSTNFTVLQQTLLSQLANISSSLKETSGRL
ncbi:hypothetical protein L596_017720 [Steinernema carpocapsae]|uniref:Uncharacterized protein n=1 Tax=Steinernema carpocapsae TaxID=34508 RepID=A0A4U5N2H9_STECR|nr:hypothetical protein L596_017720 [Steinernema carpocapsae]